MLHCRVQSLAKMQPFRRGTLAILHVTFSVALFSSGCRPRERFTHVDSQNPYIMFDQQTAQSCWAGPAQSTTPASGEFGEGELTPEEAAELQEGEDPRVANPPHLPFCKNLK
jgi:hypothetical protein